MYDGKMTEKLQALCDEYYQTFGCEPEGYVDLEYGDDYRMFKRDIKRALKKGIELPNLYPLPDGADS